MTDRINIQELFDLATRSVEDPRQWSDPAMELQTAAEATLVLLEAVEAARRVDATVDADTEEGWAALHHLADALAKFDFGASDGQGVAKAEGAVN